MSLHPGIRFAPSRIRRSALVVLAALLIASPQLVRAEAVWELVVTRTSASPVPSGDPVEFTIQFQCAAVDEAECVNSIITIPVPPEVALNNVAPHPYVESTSLTAGVLTIDLNDSIPAGSSAELILTQETHNGRTPDGFEWTVEATLTSDNTETVVDSDVAAVTAAADIGIVKDLAIGDSALFDDAVRYHINPCNPTDPDVHGNLWLETADLVDTLPPGSVFVAASDGGVYDAGAHSVTWTDINDINRRWCDEITKTSDDFWIDVQFPSADFTFSDMVTNTATVTGTAYGDPATPLTASDDIEHGFTDPAPTGSFSKFANTDYAGNQDITPAGGSGTYSMTIRNTGNVPITYAIHDAVPCVPNDHESNALGDICAQPAFITEHITINKGYVPEANWDTIELSYTTISGATGTLNVTEPNPIGGGVLAFDATTIGEDVAEWSFGPYPEVVLDPGRVHSMGMWGYWIEDEPAGTMPNAEVVRNWAHADFIFDGEIAASASDFADVGIVEPEILVGPSKQIVNDVLRLGMNNYSEVPIDGYVITDLLPAGVALLDDPVLGGDEFWLRSSAMGLDLQYNAFLGEYSGTPIDFTLEAIDNWMGTGRQLVRLTVNEVIPPNASMLLYADLDPASLDNLPLGTTVNTAQLFLRNDLIDGCKSGNNAAATAPATNDPLDLNENRVTSDDRHCIDDAGMTNTVATANLTSFKEVRGDQDTTFEGFPTVGSMLSDGDFRFTIRNDGNVDLDEFTIYDILPHVGDAGVSDTQGATPRQSEWTTEFVAMTNVPADAVVEYSASTNPCRPEVAAGASPCTADWTTTPPANVAALKITFPGTVLAPGESRSFEYSVTSPAGVLPGEVAWNSAAVYAEKADDSGPLLPTEPPKVGLAVPLSDVSVTKGIGTEPGSTTQTATVVPGTVVDFLVTVAHDGTIVTNPDGSVTYSGAPSTATGVVLTDVLPAGVSIVPGSSWTKDPGTGGVAGTFDEGTGVWTVGDVAPGEQFELHYQVIAPAVDPGPADLYTNVAAITANEVADEDSTPDNDDDTEDDQADATFTVVEGMIELTKLVEDARDSGVFIDANSTADPIGSYSQGEPVRYRFEIHNPSPVDLTEVTLTDAVVGFACDTVIPVLTAGATETVDCDWTLGWGGGQVENTATVTGFVDGDDTRTVTDDDVAWVEVVAPDLVVEKSTNGEDADAAPGPTLVLGGPATWTYEVTNTGSEALTDLSVTDDAGTPGDTADDWTLTIADLVSGDDGADAIFDPGETWVFTSTGSADSVGGYANTVKALATGSVSGIPDSDTDPSHYLVLAPEPALDVQKHIVTDATSVAGNDADLPWPDPDAPVVHAGDAVEFVITVTNSGAADLSAFDLTDDVLGPLVVGGAPEPGVICENLTDPLPPAASFDCRVEHVLADSGAHMNTATVEATPVDPGGDPLGDPIVAEDPAHAQVVMSGLEVTKSVLDPTTSSWGNTATVSEGDEVTWRIQVTNTGEVALAPVVVDDLDLASCSRTLETLAAGETSSWDCLQDPALDQGSHTNTVEVGATPIDPFGNPIGEPVDAADEATVNISTPAAMELELTKAAQAQEVEVGGNVTWDLVITNVGETPARGTITVEDVLPDELSWIGEYSGGDCTYDEVDHIASCAVELDLEAGESTTVNLTTRVETTSSGQVTNTARVLANGVSSAPSAVSDPLVVIGGGRTEQPPITTPPTTPAQPASPATPTPTPIPATPAPTTGPPLAFTGGEVAGLLATALSAVGAGAAALLGRRRRSQR